MGYDVGIDIFDRLRALPGVVSLSLDHVQGLGSYTVHLWLEAMVSKFGKGGGGWDGKVNGYKALEITMSK